MKSWRASGASDYRVLQGLRDTSSTGTIEGKTVYVTPRCELCGKQVALYAAAPYAFRCPRCQHENRISSG